MTLKGILITAAIIGFFAGAILGGVRGGVKGALIGGVSGAFIAVLATLVVIYGGIAISGATVALGAALGTSVVVMSPQICAFVIATALTAWSVHRIGDQIEEIDPAAPDADRLLLAAELELVFNLLAWAYGAARLAMSYRVTADQASSLRTQYNRANREAMEAGMRAKENGASWEQAARESYSIRHANRISTRNQMEEFIDRDALRFSDMLRYGNPDGPTFDSLVAKGQAKGYTGDAIYKYIITGSARTSTAVTTYAENMGGGNGGSR